MSAELAAISTAATIMLVRDYPKFQVLMVKRHHLVDFASGAYVFPGGKLHDGDQGPAWKQWTIGWDEFSDEQRALRIAALRELYEEAGILLARDLTGDAFTRHGLTQMSRKDVSQNRLPFVDFVRSMEILLDLRALTLFARWITPNVVQNRFDTWFFVARAPIRQDAFCDGWETVETEWIEPAEAIRLAALGDRKILFPTRMNLKLLSEAGDSHDALARAAARPMVTVEPVVEQRDEGLLVAISADAGYGAACELIRESKRLPRTD